MLSYLGRRLLRTAVLIFAIFTLTFLLLQIVPGDPIAIIMREHASPEAIARIREEMGLDDPLWMRYLRSLSDICRGDLGYSYKLKRNVSELIGEALPTTLHLAAASLLVAWGIGIPAGIIAAVKHKKSSDYIIMGFTLSGISLPVFWSALVLQNLFGLWLGWLPISGTSAGASSFLLPALVLGWSSAGSVARFTRSGLLETMHSDYIRTAYAKGLRRIAVISRHALRNALLPVITIMALQLAVLLSGSVLTESIFGLPGIGRLALNAIQNRDLPLLQATVLFEAAMVVMGNLAADLSYLLVDPRIRL